MNLKKGVAIKTKIDDVITNSYATVYILIVEKFEIENKNRGVFMKNDTFNFKLIYALLYWLTE